MYQKDLSSLDHSSMTMLYQHHALSILRLIRRHVASWEDAEDLTLEVFLVALEQEEKLTHLSVKNQLAWLRTVAHHKVVDFYRRSTIRSTLPLEEMTEMLLDDENMTPERVVVRHEEYTILHTHLAALPPQQQEILRLRFAAGLRCREIVALPCSCIKDATEAPGNLPLAGEGSVTLQDFAPCLAKRPASPLLLLLLLLLALW